MKARLTEHSLPRVVHMSEILEFRQMVKWRLGMLEANLGYIENPVYKYVS